METEETRNIENFDDIVSSISSTPNKYKKLVIFERIYYSNNLQLTVKSPKYHIFLIIDIVEKKVYFYENSTERAKIYNIEGSYQLIPKKIIARSGRESSPEYAKISMPKLQNTNNIIHILNNIQSKITNYFFPNSNRSNKDIYFRKDLMKAVTIGQNNILFIKNKDSDKIISSDLSSEYQYIRGNPIKKINFENIL
jgi:hypothetical protein